MFSKASETSSRTKVTIASYNVLSQALCTQKNYPGYDSICLDNGRRYEAVTEMITQASQTYNIISLQEVSLEWTGPLIKLFDSLGYTFITSGYGNYFNNYMGCGLAFRRASYTLENSNIWVVANTHYKYPKDNEKTYTDIMFNYTESVYNYLVGEKPKRVHPPMWHAMKTKTNKMIAVTLRDNATGEMFVAASYHMPCHFGSYEAERQMGCFIQLALNSLHRYANGKPYMLAGDFNIKPGDHAYEIMTTGQSSMPEKDMGECYPTLWKTLVHEPLRSAYKVKNKREPSWTCSSRTPYGGDFTDTLDYILISKDVDVAEVLELPDTVPTSPQPNMSQPSDHMMIGSTLMLRQ